MTSLNELKNELLTLTDVGIVISDSGRDYLCVTALKHAPETLYVSVYGVVFHRNDLMELACRRVYPHPDSFKPSVLFRNTAELKNFIVDPINNH